MDSRKLIIFTFIAAIIGSPSFALDTSVLSQGVTINSLPTPIDTASAPVGSQNNPAPVVNTPQPQTTNAAVTPGLVISDANPLYSSITTNTLPPPEKKPVTSITELYPTEGPADAKSNAALPPTAVTQYNANSAPPPPGSVVPYNLNAAPQPANAASQPVAEPDVIQYYGGAGPPPAPPAPTPVTPNNPTPQLAVIPYGGVDSPVAVTQYNIRGDNMTSPPVSVDNAQAVSANARNIMPQTATTVQPLITSGAIAPAITTQQSAAMQSLSPAGTATSPMMSVTAENVANENAATNTVQTAADIQESLTKLGPGNKIKIQVYGEEDLSGEFEIDARGNLSLPLIGNVQAAGLQPRGLEELMTSKLKEGYLVNPLISLEVLNYKPIFILGEVNHPGSYPYTTGLTVINAVALGGGFTPRAKQNHVTILRSVNEKKVELEGTESMLVYPGDTIRVEERWF